MMPLVLKKKFLDKDQTSFHDHVTSLSFCPPSYCPSSAEPNYKSETTESRSLMISLTHPTQHTKQAIERGRNGGVGEQNENNQ